MVARWDGEEGRGEKGEGIKKDKFNDFQSMGSR